MARAQTPPLDWSGFAPGGALTNDVVFVRNAVLTVLVMAMSGLAVGMAFLSIPFAARAVAPNVKFTLVHCAHAPEGINSASAAATHAEFRTDNRMNGIPTPQK